MSLRKFNAKAASNVELSDAAQGGVPSARKELLIRAIKGDSHARGIVSTLGKKKRSK